MAFVLLHAPGNVSHPNLSFTSSDARPTTTTPGQAAGGGQHVPVAALWLRRGAHPRRSRPAHGSRPPFRVGWRFNDYALLEFPPVIYQNTMYLLDDDGSAKAINKRNGRMIWAAQGGHARGGLAGDRRARADLVFVPVLSTTGHSPGNGRFVALSMKTGRIVWSRPVGAGSESSPLVWGRPSTSAIRAAPCTRCAPATVTSVLDLPRQRRDQGRPGSVERHPVLRRLRGPRLCRQRRHRPPGLGGEHERRPVRLRLRQFYSTPAVAFGRVYMGNTDGRVYSFAARTGQLAWATGTGAYVYASPAVANTPGSGPPSTSGSYDGNIYAFDARSGAVRWTHTRRREDLRLGDDRRQRPLLLRARREEARSGSTCVPATRSSSFPDGAFNPVIADPGAIYLIGYSTIYQMLPRSPQRRKRTPRTPPAKRRTDPASRRRRRRHRRAQVIAHGTCVRPVLLCLPVYALS